MPPRIETARMRRTDDAYCSVALVTCSASSRVGVSTSIFGWAALKRTRSPRARADCASWAAERGVLARPARARPQQLAPADCGRDRLFLYRGRLRVARFGHCFYDRRV